MTEDLRGRIKRIGQEAVEKTSPKLGFSISMFTLENVEPNAKESRLWDLEVWYKSQALYFSIPAHNDTPDQKLREDIEKALWEKIKTISELADRIKPS